VSNLAYLRDFNEALVVAVARTRPTFDRASIAEETGLTPQAVSKVLARLTEQGLVAVAGVRRQGVGKPASIYRLVRTSRYAIGAHVARSTLRLVLSDLVGAVVDSSFSRLPTDFTPADLLAAMRAGIAALTNAHPLTEGKLVGVGIGMVGPLDHAQGIVRDAHRLRHWHDVPLRDQAAAALEMPVFLDKDVTAGVFAEGWRQGFRDAALIMVESGIGAGLWLGGAAHRGAHTNAGEFGHTVVQLNGPACVCGRRGCLEVVHDTAADAGDVEFAARVLATGIVNLLQTVDVDHVVLAGADLIRRSDVYVAAVREAVLLEVPRADWLTVEVTVSELGADVVAAGAAMEVLNERFGVPHA
jgi:predicted NBD/HSP70 family sugar kinase